MTISKKRKKKLDETSSKFKLKANKSIMNFKSKKRLKNQIMIVQKIRMKKVNLMIKTIKEENQIRTKKVKIEKSVIIRIRIN